MCRKRGLQMLRTVTPQAFLEPPMVAHLFTPLNDNLQPEAWKVWCSRMGRVKRAQLVNERKFGILKCIQKSNYSNFPRFLPLNTLNIPPGVSVLTVT